MHLHRDLVSLPDGTVVLAASFDADDPYARDRRPDFGLYFDPRWHPPWPHDHVPWADFGLPDDPLDALAALGGAVDRARHDELVEIGCLGGHGRTGTALACLAVMAGVPAGEAVAWVREQYCPSAVETDEQARFVSGLAGADPSS